MNLKSHSNLQIGSVLNGPIMSKDISSLNTLTLSETSQI